MDHIEQAFINVPRREFLPPHLRRLADKDRPLSIGYGQTNSQPSTVRKMLEWLDPKPGHHVLDVGSGSGWTTALLSRLVGDSGTVIATERLAELVEFGRQNCARLGVSNATFQHTTHVLGWPLGAPYDRILVSASAKRLSHELLDQLKPGGKMIIPVDNDILEITVDDRGCTRKSYHSSFVFVPLL